MQRTPRRVAASALLAAALTACRAPGAADHPPVSPRGQPSMRAAPGDRPAPDPALQPVLQPALEPAPFVGGPDFTRVFDRVAPSVVGVAAGALVDGRFVVARSGTGFVWDDDGHVVTNAHLIGDAPRVRVRDQSGRVTLARLVGLDAATDLAVINPGPLDLPRVELGDVDALRPGEWVAAIGNPHGMEHSITVGVISALGRRTLPGAASKLAEFIQSDVALDIGSSGGPLVDTRGRVVGLNTAIVGGKFSFSIRADMVATVARRLIAEGAFVRGFAGLYPMATTTKVAREAGLGDRRGVRVRGVVEGGPAHAAGLLPGDIILEFGEHSVDDPDALPWLIAATRPGTEVPCQVARGSERLALVLVMGEAAQ